jgi:acyl dehydratase
VRIIAADVVVGEQLPAQTFAIDRAALVRYAGASGDFNSIHWNERVARDVGLPDVIAHGMLTMALAARVATDWAGDPGAVAEYQVRFTRPIVVPDPGIVEVTVGGKVAALDAQAGRATLDLSASVGGQTVLARAKLVVRIG